MNTTQKPDGNDRSALNTPTMKSVRKTGYYNPFYFIGLAFRSLWRNRVMSIASVLVLASCLILLGAFGLLIKNLDINLDRLGMLNEIVVFVDYDLEQSRVDNIYADIQALDNVTYVEYISKSKGLDDMKETYSDYAELFEKLDQNGDNPLADSFVITYRDNAGVNELEYALHSIPGVMKVNNRLDYATKVESLKNGISFVFLWFFVLLFVVSLFVIFNTIKLAVHSRRAEIGIMRYIGATKAFIITPFIIEGVFIGLLASIISYFTDAYIYKIAVAGAANGLQMIELIPFGDVRLILLSAFLAIGILTGVLASLTSLRKNLNN